MSEPYVLPTPHCGYCPSCGNTALQVLGAALVRYDIVFDPHLAEFVVTGESTEETGWDEQSAANCPACGWRGALATCAPHAPAV